MTERLFRVSMMHKETREVTDLMVWGESMADATCTIIDAIGGDHGEYSWVCTNSVIRDGEFVEREVEQ